MALASSTITQNILLADGSRRITEMHVDHLGVSYPVDYTARPTDDVASRMAKHGSDILLSLRDIELDGIRRKIFAGEPVRSIQQNYSRVSELKAILVEYEAEAERDKIQSALEHTRIDAAKVELG